MRLCESHMLCSRIDAIWKITNRMVCWRYGGLLVCVASTAIKWKTCVTDSLSSESLQTTQIRSIIKMFHTFPPPHRAFFPRFFPSTETFDSEFSIVLQCIQNPYNIRKIYSLVYGRAVEDWISHIENIELLSQPETLISFLIGQTHIFFIAFYAYKRETPRTPSVWFECAIF